MPIQSIKARQIYDSRGNPTVEVSELTDLFLSSLAWIAKKSTTNDFILDRSTSSRRMDSSVPPFRPVLQPESTRLWSSVTTTNPNTMESPSSKPLTTSTPSSLRNSSRCFETLRTVYQRFEQVLTYSFIFLRLVLKWPSKQTSTTSCWSLTEPRTRLPSELTLSSEFLWPCAKLVPWRREFPFTSKLRSTRD